MAAHILILVVVFALLKFLGASDALSTVASLGIVLVLAVVNNEKDR